MNGHFDPLEPSDPLEQAIRQRLVRDASDVPDAAALRERVRVALEAENTVRQIPTSPFWSRSKRTAALVALAAFTVLAGVVLAGQTQRNLVVVTDAPTTDSDETIINEGAPQRIEPSAVRDAVASATDAVASGMDMEATGAWSIHSEVDHVLTLEFVPNEVEPEDSPQFLRIVTPPVETTAEEVVASITRSLFDTVATGDTDGRIGGISSRSLRLETVEGTTSLGFRIAEGAYLETGGVNRVFVTHITGSPSETVVFWVEASPDHIDSLEAAASRFIDFLIEG